MPAVRPKFKVKIVTFSTDSLLEAAELDDKYSHILHVLNVGNNLSIWLTDDNTFQSVDIYGFEVMKLAELPSTWKIVHAILKDRNHVEVWIADPDSAEIPEEN